MLEFKIKLGQNGRIAIPAPCRQALGITAGEELIIQVEDGEAKLFSLKHAISQVQETVSQYNKKQTSLSNELIKMRREESKAARKN